VQRSLVNWNGFLNMKLSGTLISYSFGDKSGIHIDDEIFKDDMSWAKNDLVPGIDSGPGRWLTGEPLSRIFKMKCGESVH
jgi:hypothetical protein